MEKLKAKFIDDAMTTDSELSSAVNFLQSQISGTTINPVFSLCHSFVTSSAPTDVFSIGGVSGKSIQIRKIGFQSLTAVDGKLILRSSNTGGTSETITGIPHDTGTPTAHGKAYTANPTLGSEMSIIRTVMFDNGAEWVFEMPICLTVGEELVLNINSQTKLDVFIEWAEA
jgi:hypothetical protein